MDSYPDMPPDVPGLPGGGGGGAAGGGGGSGPSKDVQKIKINMALQNIKLAKEYEAQELFEAAKKHYLIATNQLMELIRGEPDPQRKEVFKKHAQSNIT